MAKVYEAKEREETAIPITDVFSGGEADIYAEVQKKKYFEIRFRGTKLIVTAGKYVGLIPLNDRVIIDVRPKMPVTSLMKILSKVDRHVHALSVADRDYALTDTVPGTILDAMAAGLIRSLRHVEVEGLLKRYVPVREMGPWVKGRIVFDESVQRRWSQGIRHSAVCEYFDLTSDTRENRLLHYACHLLLVQYGALGGGGKLARDLSYFEELFARSGVALGRAEWTSDDILQADLSGFYRRALALANAIVRNRGVELPSGGRDISLPSLLVDMDLMFEAYMRLVLKERLATFKVFDGNSEGSKPLFDDRTSPMASPDIVVIRDMTPMLVADAKYKPKLSREDANQIVTYAVSYAVKTVVLVMPVESPEASGLSLLGNIKGIDIWKYGFCLGASRLEEEEERFSTSIEDLLEGANVGDGIENRIESIA